MGEGLVRFVGRAGDAFEEGLLQSAKHDVAGCPLNDCHWPLRTFKGLARNLGILLQRG
jgi:hypothetical protein